MDQNTRILYDYELEYPIGKIGVDEYNVPEMIDINTYIISQLVPMPMLPTYKINK